MTRATPAWVRVAAALIQRMPAGRYRLAHALGSGSAPFTMSLPARLGGHRVRCDLRDSISREVCFTGTYEPQETAIASAVLRPGMVAVDAGANWGYFSLVFAHLVGASGRVVAFEPEPRLFGVLRDAVRVNGLTQVTALQMAVAARRERVQFAAYHERDGNSGVSRRAIGGLAGDFECEAASLDDVLDRERIPQVDLVKMDIEGGELDALRGMARGLAAARYRHVLLECHPGAVPGLTVDACATPLLDAGYRIWHIDHSPDMHRRAAAGRARPSDMLRPFAKGAHVDAWPHLFAVAPGAAALA